MTENKKEYKCEQCNFECKYKAQWNIHIETELHKTGKKKKRSDTKEPLKCEKCEYKTKNRLRLESHILNEHSTKEEREKKYRYYCKYCDTGTFTKDIMENHEKTKKHKNFVAVVEK